MSAGSMNNFLKIDGIGGAGNIPGWPERDTIAGLLDALSRWRLDMRLDYSRSQQFIPHPERKPFRSACLRYAGKRYSASKGIYVYEGGPPMYPDAPDVVRYLGNFVGYSYGFSLDTNDLAIIRQLDEAISQNIERQQQGMAA